MDRIYMDNSATTRISKPVLEAMMPCLTEAFGNPSSVHSFGRDAKKLLETARRQLAAAINAEPVEIYFTGSGTESDNWAIRGAAYANKKKGNHIITSSIEHHAVLHTVEQLEKEGFTATYLPVDEYGLVDPETLRKAMTPETMLVSIMMANNEIGTVQPVADLAKVAHEGGALFHTDAVQALGAVPLNVHDMGIDLLSVSGHKLHGPKGVGALYIRKGVVLQQLIYGGAQERGKRGGTENLALIVGFGRAAELSMEHFHARNERIAAMRDRLIEGILAVIPETRLNGHPTKRLPGNCNVSIRYIEGEGILIGLDLMGVAGSSGSACTSGSLDPSHVLLAIGLPHEIAHGSLRLSLSDENTMEEVDKVIEVLASVVERLRSMSPLYSAK